MPLTPQEREQKLREQAKFLMSIEHEFVNVQKHIQDGEVHMEQHRQKLANLERMWHEAQNEIATKQHNFESKMSRLKGIREEDWDSHRGEVETAFREYREACSRGIAHTQGSL